MSEQRILFVDDDKHLSEVLAFTMREQGRFVETVHSVDEALVALKEKPLFDAIITDLRMPGRSGLELVKEVCRTKSHPPIIVLTAHGSVDTAVDAMREGAADFLAKPIGRDVLGMTLDRVIRRVDLEKENAFLKQKLEAVEHQGDIIGRSKAILNTIELATRVAPTDATVLIRGASGTGKELIARLVHQRSRRAKKPFIALNCAALPKDLLESELFGHAKGAFTGALSARKGRFVEADGGTLFLDEIGDLDLELQAKLLRVLSDGVVDVLGGGRQKVNVRIVAATHKDLEAMARDGAFRQDLYFRIRVVPVELPLLRERGSDIGLLFAAFVRREAGRSGQVPPGISPELIAALAKCPWPGNVRELENVATRMVVTAPAGEPLGLDLMLPQDGRVNLQGALPESAEATTMITANQVELPDEQFGLEDVERALIVAALSKCGGNRSKAARLLKVARHVLLYRLDKFQITDDEVTKQNGEGRAPLVKT